MIISKELETATKELGESNLLSVTRTVSDFLRESTNDEILCSYIEKNGYDVSFRDELISLVRTKKFPTDPKINLPFSYTLLHLFDSKKLSPEDILFQVFPGADIGDAYASFFRIMADTLLDSFINADPEFSDSDAENSEETNEANAFELFVSLINGIAGADSESMTSTVLSLKKALEENDESAVKFFYYGLENFVKKTKLGISSLDGIKVEIANKGITL